MAGATLVAASGAASAAESRVTAATFFTRISGSDRFATAAQVAVKAFPNGVANVVLASGGTGHTVDALSGNYLAGLTGAPVLLTGVKSTPAATLTALQALKAKTITVLGGSSAVSDGQVKALRDKHYEVHRLNGMDRYETNKAVVEQLGVAAVGTYNGKKTAIVATGQDFPDALAAGALSDAAHFPVIITAKKTLSASAAEALKDLQIRQVIVAGGENAVSRDDRDAIRAMGITIAFEASGADRSATSMLLADWAIDYAGFTETHLNVASGAPRLDGADALSGASYAGMEKAPVLVTNGVTQAGSVVTFAAEHARSERSGHIFGGTSAVSDAVADAVAGAIADVPADVYPVTPSTPQTPPAGGSVDLTVSGIQAQTVDIALTSCANVLGGGAFADADHDGKADLGGTHATISGVNGVPVATPSDYYDNAAVVNGAVQLTVTDAADECVAAVVYDDANGDNALNVDATGHPTESYGVTGTITFGGLRPLGTANGVYVTRVGDAPNTFVGCDLTTPPATYDPGSCATYSYDANDVYYLGSSTNTLSMAEFAQKLSIGDTVTGTYAASAGGSSTFVLHDQPPAPPAAPSAPASLTAQPTSGLETTSVTLRWGPPATGTADTYNIYRASGNCGTPIFPAGFTKVGSVAAGTTEYADNGLAASTAYCYAVTAVGQAQESGAVFAAATTATSPVLSTNPPVLQSAVANDVDDGIGQTNQVRYVFDETVANPVANNFLVFPSAQPTLACTGTAATLETTNVTHDTVVVTMDCTLADATSDLAYTAKAKAGAVTSTGSIPTSADRSKILYY